MDANMAAAREQLHDKLLPVVLALLRVGRLPGGCTNINLSHDFLIATATTLLLVPMCLYVLGGTKC